MDIRGRIIIRINIKIKGWIGISSDSERGNKVGSRSVCNSVIKSDGYGKY